MYSQETKSDAIAMHAEGVNSADICSDLKISRSTLYYWIQQYDTDKYKRLSRDEYLMLAELNRLREENCIFRKCGCTPSSQLKEKLQAIDEHKNEFPIHRLCKTLDVNRSTYYNHSLRSVEKTQVKIMDEILKPLIKEIFAKSRRTFGARRIKVKLQEAGYNASAKRINRLMKELGLYARGPKPMKNSANDRQYKYYPNKLKGDFLTDAPNTIWVSDITYIKIESGFVYLCVVVDLYSRKVISYKISEKANTRLVRNTFSDAFKSRGCPKGLTFHSDQGTQYTSYSFRSLLRSKGVTLSYSRPGTPQDNAVVESFFSSIKKEDFRRTFYETKQDVMKAVDSYIEFYNDYRPHQSLNYMTPNKTEDLYFHNLKS